MIRKKGLIAAAILAVLSVLFGYFFLDGMIKSSIVWSGQKMFKAKVEVQSVHLDIFRSKLTIRGLNVADSSREFKNAFSAKEITADIMVLPLLEKKVIIDAVKVLDCSAGTDRKTSGFLAAPELKKIEKDGEDGLLSGLYKKAEEKATDAAHSLPISKIGELKDIGKADFKSMVKKEDSAAYRASMEAKAGMEERRKKAEEAIKALDVQKKAEDLKKSINKVKSVQIKGVDDIPAAKEALKELENIRKDSVQVAKSAAEAKDLGAEFYAYSKEAVASVNAAKEKDVAAVMEKANLNMLDAGVLENAIIGPVWTDRVNKSLYYLKIAKKYIPVTSKKKKKLAVEKRGIGRLVYFPGSVEYPKFWIKQVTLSVSGADKGSAYYMKGKITDITPEQAKIGRPLTVMLELDNPSQTIQVAASINHIKTINDSLTVSMSNMPASSIGLDKVKAGSAAVESARSMVKMDVTYTDGEIRVKGTAGASDIKWKSEQKEDVAYLALKNIDAFRAVINIIHTEKSTSMDIKSDIYDSLKASLKKLYGNKASAAKTDAKKAVDLALKGDVDSVSAMAGAYNKDLEAKIKEIADTNSSINAEIEKAKAEINKKIGAASGGVLKGLFK